MQADEQLLGLRPVCLKLFWYGEPQSREMPFRQICILLMCDPKLSTEGLISFVDDVHRFIRF